MAMTLFIYLRLSWLFGETPVSIFKYSRTDQTRNLGRIVIPQALNGLLPRHSMLLPTSHALGIGQNAIKRFQK